MKLSLVHALKKNQANKINNFSKLNLGQGCFVALCKQWQRNFRTL